MTRLNVSCILKLLSYIYYQEYRYIFSRKMSQKKSKSTPKTFMLVFQDDNFYIAIELVCEVLIAPLDASISITFRERRAKFDFSSDWDQIKSMLTLSKLKLAFRSNRDLSPCRENDKKDYRKLAEDALQNAISIIESEGWKKERSHGNDIIFSKTVPIYGKIFKFEGTLNMPPDKVIDILYFKGEEMHKWNPTVKRVKVIEKIDDHVDISHVIATEGAAGLVASRDFVNIRIWKKKNSDYLHGSVATTHPDVPAVTKYVRGEQGPCVYILTPIDETSQQCKLQWLLNTNLKGWIPQYLIDQTLSTVMLDYVHSLRKFAATSKASV